MSVYISNILLLFIGEYNFKKVNIFRIDFNFSRNDKFLISTGIAPYIIGGVVSDRMTF